MSPSSREAGRRKALTRWLVTARLSLMGERRVEGEWGVEGVGVEGSGKALTRWLVTARRSLMEEGGGGWWEGSGWRLSGVGRADGRVAERRPGGGGVAGRGYSCVGSEVAAGALALVPA